MDDFRLRLGKLETFEHDSLNAIINKEGKSLKRQELAKTYLTSDPYGRESLFDRSGNSNWGNASDQMPVLEQLLINKYLILDLKTCQSENEFIQNYGLTSFQLLTLAQERFLCINLYAYDSQKKVDFEAYRRTPNILGFLDLERVDIRIISLRRSAFLKDISGEILSPVGEPSELLRQNLEEHIDLRKQRNKHDLDASISTSTSHYQVVKSFLPLLKKDDIKSFKLVDLLVTQFEQKLLCNQKVTSQDLVMLRGLKTSLASPLTSTMGGIYNMSEGAFKSIYPNPGFINHEQLILRRQMDVVTREFLEYVSSMQSINKQAYKSKPFEKLSDASFNSFLSFLKANRESTTMLTEILSDLSKNDPTNLSFKLNQGQTYLEIENRLNLELINSAILKKVAGIVISATSAFLPAEYLHLPKISIPLIGLTSSVLLTDASNLIPERILLNKSKVRLLKNLNKTSQIIKK